MQISYDFPSSYDDNNNSNNNQYFLSHRRHIEFHKDIENNHYVIDQKENNQRSKYNLYYNNNNNNQINNNNNYNNIDDDDDDDDDSFDDHQTSKNVKTKDKYKNIIPSHYQKPIRQITEKNPIILEVGPGEHQIKDYNFHPVNVLLVNYQPHSSDFIVVKLICDPRMNRSDPEIFILGLSPLFYADESNRIFLHNLKISKDMLKGRTKGYEFNLEYSLFIRGSIIYSIRSDSFKLWSNVNQNGFPKEKRSEYVNQTESINKKRKKSKMS